MTYKKTTLMFSSITVQLYRNNLIEVLTVASDQTHKTSMKWNHCEKIEVDGKIESCEISDLSLCSTYIHHFHCWQLYFIFTGKVFKCPEV